MSLNQQAKKGFSLGANCPYYQRQAGLLLFNGNIEEYIRIIEDTLGSLLVFLCFIIKVNEKSQPNSGVLIITGAFSNEDLGHHARERTMTS